MNEAIKLAIEKGGYEVPTRSIADTGSADWEDDISAALLDPAFWQALGKALGWDLSDNYKTNIWPQEEYLFHWHRFIDHLAEGKSPDDFFKALLAERKDV